MHIYNIYIHIYIYIHINIYIYIDIYIYIYVCVYKYVCIYVYKGGDGPARPHLPLLAPRHLKHFLTVTSMYAFVCTYIRMCIAVLTYMCVHALAYVYICIYIHACTYVCAHVYNSPSLPSHRPRPWGAGMGGVWAGLGGVCSPGIVLGS